MKTLTTLLVSSLLALAAGCGDNMTLQDGRNAARDSEVIIIPHQGEALSALQDAEDLGFTDAILFEDGGYISAFGDLDLVDELVAMPTVDVAGSPDDVEPLLPDLPLDPHGPALNQKLLDGRDIEGEPNTAINVEPTDEAPDSLAETGSMDAKLSGFHVPARRPTIRR